MTQRLRLVLAAGFLLSGGNSQAQDDPRAQDLDALRSSVQQLEKSLQEVRAKLAELERQKQDTNVVVPTVPAGPLTKIPSTDSNYMFIADQKIQLPVLPPGLTNLGQSPIPDYDAFNDQQAAPRPDNKPIDPALKGFIPIPGTKSMIRFGGSARIDGIYDFENNGNPNQFVPSSIPVEGEPGVDAGPDTTIEAKGTRISFEIRRPVATGSGSLRIYNENDFFNDSTSPNMSFRVRHFYGQAWNLLVGQTFTTFMNIDAWPDVVDYAGPNALINRRQAQVRYSPSIYEGVGEMNLLFSVEQPGSDVDTTATGVPAGADPNSRAPDGVAGWRWEGGVGHVQLAGLFRSIGYSAPNNAGQTVFGWGSSGSGAFNLFKADKFLWQVSYGHGMARYVNDISSESLDAALNASGDLEAIPVFAAVVGYTHEWSKHFRSTASFGYVDVDPTASLGALAIDSTTYSSINLVWHPTTSFRMGLEYLYGTKKTQGGADGDGHRLDFVLRYDLVR